MTSEAKIFDRKKKEKKFGSFSSGHLHNEKRKFVSTEKKNVDFFFNIYLYF